MMHGAWCMMQDIWCMMHDAWCDMVMSCVLTILWEWARTVQKVLELSVTPQSKSVHKQTGGLFNRDSLRIKFYSHPPKPRNVPCKLHEKQCKVHGFLCSLNTSQTCTYWIWGFRKILGCTSWNIPNMDMDICRQDICCLDKCNSGSWLTQSGWSS